MNAARAVESALIIEVRDLVKRYSGVCAVNGVSFEVARGEIFGLLGPNGAGKTTTLGVLQGLKRADEGRVRVLGYDLAHDARPVRARVGVQLQSTSLLPDFSALDQVLLFARLYGRSLTRGQAHELLERVGLVEGARRRPGQLSGGQCQRLALALALVNEPELVFVDEPSAGLDPQGRRALWELLRGLRLEGRTVVLTTHDIDEAEALCDRVGIIDHGRLVTTGRPAELVAATGLEGEVVTATALLMQDVSGLPGVRGVQADGPRLRLRSADVEATRQALVELARARAAVLGLLEVRRPCLEDVFLHLTGRSMRDA